MQQQDMYLAIETKGNKQKTGFVCIRCQNLFDILQKKSENFSLGRKNFPMRKKSSPLCFLRDKISKMRQGQGMNSKKRYWKRLDNNYYDFFLRTVLQFYDVKVVLPMPRRHV